MIKKAVFLVSAFLFSAFAFAGDTPEAQANLQQFVGSWKQDNAKFVMGDKTLTGIYTIDCSAVCENTGILAHEKFSTKETGSMIGENLMGYDPNTGLVHLYSIDNTGTTHDHYGYWIDKSHLFVQYQGIVENKMYVEQIDIKFHSPDKMELNVTGMINGKVYAKSSGTFTK